MRAVQQEERVLAKPSFLSSIQEWVHDSDLGGRAAERSAHCNRVQYARDS